MDRTFDVVIIGGGVIGSSIAYFLTANSDFHGKVAVIERDPSYTTASSSLSASSYRHQFATRPNIQMSAASVAFLKDTPARLGVDGHPGDIGLREAGYLFLGGPERVAAFEARHKVQLAEGADIELLSPDDLARRYPGLNTEGIAIASLGRSGEGWFDGPALHQAYRRKARAQGAVYLTGDATGFQVEGDRLTAATLADGSVVSGGIFLNCAGAWSGRVARTAGVELPVVPQRNYIFVVESPATLPGGHVTHDITGMWIRPEGRLYICSTSPRVLNDPEDYELVVDYGLFDEEVWPALAHRFPAFEQLRMLRAWAGNYDYNLFDHSAVLGHVPQLSNFIMANGFSGHGMMHSAAAGLGVSELIAYGAYRSIDLAPFGYERIAANRPLPEPVY